MSSSPMWFCSQLGAREHYAIPRALHTKGLLGGLMTDYWAGNSVRAFAERYPNRLLRSLASRYQGDIPSHLVRSWNFQAFLWELQLRNSSRRSAHGRYLGYCDIGRKFSLAVGRYVRGQSKDGNEGRVFFGYDTCCLEAMTELKDLGFTCILGQIDPCRVEIDMVQSEERDWPGWTDASLDVPDEFFERHQLEWKLADRVIVNSEFSRLAMVQQGVPNSKIVVVPLCYERPAAIGRRAFPTNNFPERLERQDFTRNNPLRVLFLGQVMLRKGIQYLMEAARLLNNAPVIFDVVGPLKISGSAVESAPNNFVFHGRANRSDVENWYRRSHVFVLPTLSDGFAITQIEAMAYGLPVISTANCGAVVSNGVDGFVVGARSASSIAEAVLKYINSPKLLDEHRLAALEKSKLFSPDTLSGNLISVIQNYRCSQGSFGND